MHSNYHPAVGSNPLRSSVRIVEAVGAVSAIWKGTHFLPTLVALVTLCLGALVRADEQVPFNGEFNPVAVSVTQIDDTHAMLEFDVYIQATHLGKARGPAFGVLDQTTFIYVGEAIWTAANGDAVFITFVGQFLPTDTFGLFNNVETLQVVGGTGRFEGAIGIGVAGGQFDLITASAPTPVPFTGTISSPGSAKK